MEEGGGGREWVRGSEGEREGGGVISEFEGGGGLRSRERERKR